MCIEYNIAKPCTVSVQCTPTVGIEFKTPELWTEKFARVGATFLAKVLESYFIHQYNV